MAAFAARRALQMVASLWAALTLVFAAVTLLPGDPVRGLFGDRPPPPEVYAAVTAQYHLDEPLPVQYLLWLGDVLIGNLGRGFPVDAWGEPGGGPEVTAVLAATAPVSAVLLLGALVVQSVVGVVAGALAAGGRRGGPGVYAGALLLVGTPVLVAASALRPALTAVVTFVAADVGQLFVGLIVVERVFGMPGLGAALVEAIRDRDRALLLGLTAVVMAVVIVANAVADVAVAALDPRVRIAQVG